MTQKILNVKNILRIIISVLIIFSMLKSCAKAVITNDTYTYKKINFNGTREEALQAAWQIYNYPWITSNATSANNQSAMLNVLTDYNYFVLRHMTSGYDLFYLTLSNNEDMGGASKQQRYYLAPSGPYDRIYFFDTLNSSGTGYSVNLKNCDYVLKYKNGEYYEYSVNDSTIVNDTFEFEPNYDAITNYNGYNELYTKKYDYSINNWLLGNLTPSENNNIYDIQLLDEAANILFKDTYNNEYGTNTNDNFFISRIDNNLYIKSMALSYKKIYTLVVYPKDNQGNISDNNFVGTYMYLPLNATISGDTIVSTGSGDYTTQDSTNVIVDTLNSMFTLSSGDISDLRDEMEEVLQLDQFNPMGGVVTLLENVQSSEPGDFEIKWDPIYYENQIIIPSGDINFSAIVRDNFTLATVHNYTQIVVGGAMIFLILNEIWRCIAITLGFGFELNDKEEENNQVIIDAGETYNANTGVTTQRVTARQGNRRYTIVRRK